MATVKVVLHKYKKLKNGDHPFYLRMIKNRKIKYISIGHSCTPEFWDFANDKLSKKHPNFKRLSTLLKDKEVEAQKIVLQFENDNIDFSFDDFTRKFKGLTNKKTVISYFDEWIKKFEKLGKVGNANVYKDTKRTIINFREGKDLFLNEIDYVFLKRFEEYFLYRGVKSNTISVYMRTLRALYNKAINENIVKKEDYPFNKYKVGRLNKETAKRAITKDDINRIIKLDLLEDTSLWHSRNYFLFSFYNMGMNFMDIALIKWTNISNERLEYIRAKTGKQYSIGLLQPAVDIIDFYRVYNPGDTYVFPILKSDVHISPQSINNRIKKSRKKLNKDLKEIAELAGIDGNITSYVARHSWATILKRSGVSTSVISEGLGHRTETTTQVYLDSFENATMDEANKKILLP